MLPRRMPLATVVASNGRINAPPDRGWRQGKAAGVPLGRLKATAWRRFWASKTALGRVGGVFEPRTA